jgi:hypothetical protein
MNDCTESFRRSLVQELDMLSTERAALEEKHGQVWDTDELQRDFDVIGFLAPFVGVRRRADGVRGSLLFQASPRFYFGFTPG